MEESSIQKINKTKIIGMGIGLFFICCSLFLGYTNFVIVENKNLIYHNLEELPQREIALIFGGGMEPDGSQSDMQLDRVKTGIDLYKKGKVKKLIMTGDDGGNRVNEVDAMKLYAIQQGIPIHDIAVDPHGYRTYESCYREANVYELEKVVAVSQDFHLPRIIYFCSHFGIDTIGFSADYQGFKQTDKNRIREMLARLKGWWQVNVTQPEATVVE